MNEEVNRAQLICLIDLEFADMDLDFWISLNCLRLGTSFEASFVQS